MTFLFLIGNIIFSSLFALCIKWVQNRQREDIVTVGMLNYVVCAIAIAPEFLTSGSFDMNAAIAGGTLGGAYFIAFFFVVFAIKRIGASASTVISVLSIVLPILAGIYIWQESPRPLQIAGIVFALLSLSLISGSTQAREKEADRKSTIIDKPSIPENEKPWFTPLVLVTFFLLCGISRLAQEAFKHVCDPSVHRPTFLFVAFVVASIPSLIILLYRRRAISRGDWTMGIGLGLANILQTHFILKSLEYYDGFIVFPVSSAGGLMFTTLVAIVFLHERLTRKTCCGVALAVVALCLLHWLPGSH